MGLAKMRYEQEAWGWAKDTIHRLYTKGLVYVKDALPVSKSIMFLKSCECPSVLLDKCVECIEILSHIGVPLSLGYTHHQTISQATDIAHNGIPVATALDLYREQEGTQLTLDMQAARELAEEKKLQQQVDVTIGARLLVNMVEEGSWMNLTAPVDELLMHAAYLCVPFVPYGASHGASTDSEPKDDADDNSDRMGQQQFTAHVQELQVLSPDDQKDSVRQRYRAALLLSTPYVLGLKVDGISVVRDLLTVPLPSLNLPAPLMAQVEALLSVVVSVAANAKIVPTTRNYLTQPKDLFTIPVMYDPKFQRSPTDPFGRPARLGDIMKQSVQKKHKGHHSAANGSNNSGGVDGSNEKVAIDYEALPGGLWKIHEDDMDDENNHLDAGSFADKMWQFNASTISSVGMLDQSSIGSIESGRNKKHQKSGSMVNSLTDADSLTTNSSSVAKHSVKSTLKEPTEDKASHAPSALDMNDVRVREASWNRRDYQTVVQQAKNQETENSMAPVNPKHALPLVTLGLRGPNNELLAGITAASAMERAEMKALQASVRSEARSATQQHATGKKKKKLTAKPPLTMKLTKSELESTERMHAYHKDITLRMDDDFVRPYVCSYPHCGQSFSRLYTLRVHEKSHVNFPEYHKHKRELKVFLDDDIHAVAGEREQELLNRTSLSQPVLRELDQLSRSGSASMSPWLDSRGMSHSNSAGGEGVELYGSRLGTSSGSRSRLTGTASGNRLNTADRSKPQVQVRPFYSRDGSDNAKGIDNSSSANSFLPPINYSVASGSDFRSPSFSQPQLTASTELSQSGSVKQVKFGQNSVSFAGTGSFEIEDSVIADDLSETGVGDEDFGEQCFMFG
jgi:hypothetical protein